MISNVKQVIAAKLKQLYPNNTIYDEDVPQNFREPSFLITLTNQDYGKLLNTKFKSLLSFDIAYFSDKGKTDIKEDCQDVQMMLFRAFDLVGGYRILNKQATIVDNVLHLTFDVSVSEIKIEDGTPMQKQHTNTNI